MFIHKYYNNMKKATARKGDTLIEVTLAVGIFSMVAVAVLAVMNGSASSAQTALEATLTREEIDAQADALRFIHSAYVADKSIAQSDSRETKSVTQIMADSDYAKLWHEIISNPANTDSLAAYPPSTCETAYSDTSLANAFILNTHLLGEINNGTTDNIVIRPTDGSNLFIPASTYPRLVYADSASLLANNNTFQSAEGLYIVPVPEQLPAGSTDSPSYYDFYIRSCWYGIGDRDTAPSTISTVMRLYNPDYIKPTEIASCTNDASYIMVDTNMYVNGSNDLTKKGVKGINLAFSNDSIDTENHNICLDTSAVYSPGLFDDGSDLLTFHDDLQDSSADCSPSERLKVRTGSGYAGNDKHLDGDPNRYDGGDLWYPVHVGEQIKVVLASKDHKLYYDSSTGSSGNPFICDLDGVDCRFCTVDDPDTTQCNNRNGNHIDYYKKGVENGTVNFNGANRLEVTIKSVSSCVTNTEITKLGGVTLNLEKNPRAISINTNWLDESHWYLLDTP